MRKPTQPKPQPKPPLLKARPVNTAANVGNIVAFHLEALNADLKVFGLRVNIVRVDRIEDEVGSRG